jgi:8-oxo-dGTP pyrophosphatase MutT (NUDIX family)
MPDPKFSNELIRSVLMREPSPRDFEPLWPAQTPQNLAQSLRGDFLPSHRAPAAVLVPLIDRDSGLNVLLTKRSETLREHAGQISFPGGRIESADASPWHAALRETHEEIGLAPEFVEFAGYLPDHLVGTGFRVTPAVGFVNAPLRLRLARDEVDEVFEVPLTHIFDLANRRLRRRRFGDTEVEFHDIDFQNKNIWGATAGMLLTLQRLLDGGGSPR